MIFILSRTRQVLIIIPFRVNNVRQPHDNDLQDRDHLSAPQVHQVPEEFG